MTRILTCFLISLISYQLNAQIIPFNTEPVKQSDFSPVSPLVTPETEAVILQKYGETVLDATRQTGFFTEFHYFKRVLILNKNALDQTKDYFYFNSENDSKKFKTLHIATYNLVNGQIVKTELDRKDLFIEDPKEEVHKVKFVYPNARAGSILEIEYTFRSGSTDPQDWYFQEDHPVLHSSYSVSVPSIWNFVITLQNKAYLTSVKKDSIAETIHSVMNDYENTMVFTINWTFDNVPAMKEEAFVSTIKNYIGCIKFQLNVRPLRAGHSEQLINDWQWVSNRLLKNDDFGLQITVPEPWAYKLAKTIVQPDDSDLEKAKKIYAYVRDHLKADSRGWGIKDNARLNDIYKAGHGNVAEINLIMIALLRSQKLHAEGVILGTRDEGLTNVNFPILENFNYTICRLEIGGKIYFLDASDPTLGFGKLPLSCYNGQARVIDEKPFPVFLSPDSIRESSNAYADIEYDSAKKTLNLEWTEHPGYYKSSEIRQVLPGNNNSQDSYFKTYTKDKVFSGTPDSFNIANIKNLDEQVTVTYKTRIRLSDEEIFYFNPMMNAGITKNPFTSTERNYPVELPYVFDQTYLLNMEIPGGYEVEELPKSVRVKLNDNDGVFEYLIQKNENMIQLKYVLNIKKATFDPEDYNNLRDFYTFIVKKEAENIVFKKMKRP